MKSLGMWLRALTALLALAGLHAGCWSLLAADRAGLLHHPGRASLSALLTGAAALALQAALAWLTLVAAVVLLEPVWGRDLSAYAGCPPALRRLLLAVCGVAAIGALAAPAQATTGVDPSATGSAAPPIAGVAGHGDRSPTHSLDGLAAPDRTLGPLRSMPRSTADLARPRPEPSVRSIVVRPGDSLWGIARRLLPHAADAASVDRTWRAIYARNRSAIGPDPGLIQPGTRLRIPGPTRPGDRPDHPTAEQEEHR